MQHAVSWHRCRDPLRSAESDARIGEAIAFADHAVIPKPVRQPRRHIAPHLPAPSRRETTVRRLESGWRRRSIFHCRRRRNPRWRLPDIASRRRLTEILRFDIGVFQSDMMRGGLTALSLPLHGAFALRCAILSRLMTSKGVGAGAMQASSGRISLRVSWIVRARRTDDSRMHRAVWRIDSAYSRRMPDPFPDSAEVSLSVPGSGSAVRLGR